MNKKFLPRFFEPRSGFTLVELLISIAIIAILSATVLGVINPVEQQKKARDAVRRGDLAKISLALEQYYADHNAYPVTTNGDLPNDANFTSYMKNNVPTEVLPAYRYCYNAGTGQDYVLCSVSESLDGNDTTFGGTPCSVLASGAGAQPSRYCVRNPF